VQAQHGCLKIYGLLGYPQYDLVDHRSEGALEIKVSGRSPIRALFWH
jgi:hypothetical protein